METTELVVLTEQDKKDFYQRLEQAWLNVRNMKDTPLDDKLYTFALEFKQIKKDMHRRYGDELYAGEQMAIYERYQRYMTNICQCANWEDEEWR